MSLQDASIHRGKGTRAWAMLQIASWKSSAATRKVMPLEEAGGDGAPPVALWLHDENCRTQAENSPPLIERASLETPLPEMIAIERRVREALY